MQSLGAHRAQSFSLPNEFVPELTCSRAVPPARPIHARLQESSTTPARSHVQSVPQKEKNMAILRKSLALGVTLLSLVTSVAQAQTSHEVARGLSWLQGQVAADGTIASEATSIATTAQTRSETALCLATLVDVTAVSANLRGKLVAVVDEPTEHLARKAIALNTVAADISTPVRTPRPRATLR